MTTLASHNKSNTNAIARTLQEQGEQEERTKITRRNENRNEERD